MQNWTIAFATFSNRDAPQAAHNRCRHSCSDYGSCLFFFTFGYVLFTVIASNSSRLYHKSLIVPIVLKHQKFNINQKSTVHCATVVTVRAVVFIALHICCTEPFRRLNANITVTSDRVYRRCRDTSTDSKLFRVS